MRILLGCFIFGIIGIFTVVGIATPGVGWFLYVFLIPFWAMFPIIIIGPKATVGLLAVYLIGYPVAKLILSRNPAYQKAAREMKAKGSTNVRRHGDHFRRQFVRLIVVLVLVRWWRLLGRWRQFRRRWRVGKLVATRAARFGYHRAAHATAPRPLLSNPATRSPIA